MISTLQTLLLFLRRWHMWVVIENHRRWDGGFFLCSEPCRVQKSLTALLFVGFTTKKHSWTMIQLTMQARWASECYFKDHANYFVVDMCKNKEKEKWMKQFSGQKPKSSENVWIVSSSCTIYWFNDYKLNHSKRAHFLHHMDDLAIGRRTNLTSWKFFPQSTQKLFAFLNVGRTWNNWKQFGTKWTGDMLNFSNVFNKLFCSLALFSTSLTNMYG